MCAQPTTKALLEYADNCNMLVDPVDHVSNAKPLTRLIKALPNMDINGLGSRSQIDNKLKPWPPLLGAACSGQEEYVTALAKGGADVNKVTEDGDSALLATAFNGGRRLSHDRQCAMIRQLLALGADHAARTPIYKNDPSENPSLNGDRTDGWTLITGETALEIARDRGCNPARDILQEWESRCSDPAYVSEFVAKVQAELAERQLSRDRERRDQALAWAAKAGKLSKVRLLLQAGADPNAESGAALRNAVAADDPRMVAALVEAGAELNDAANAISRHVPFRWPDNSRGWYSPPRVEWKAALRCAAEQGCSAATTTQLLVLGADYTAVYGNKKKGMTALEIAEESDNESDGHTASKKGKGVAGVLRDWAAAHPDAEYDERIAAYDKGRQDQVRCTYCSHHID